MLASNCKVTARRRLAVVVSIVLFGCSTFLAAESGYRIGPRDLIDLEVLQVPELSGEFRVGADGAIRLPVIGEVQVSGLTLDRLRQRLIDAIEGEYLQRGQATLDVTVSEYRSAPINVIGAVAKAGPLDLGGRWTLLEALTSAGGLTTDHGPVVHVLRRADNGLTAQLAIDLDDLLVQADPRVNIPVFPGDLINVAKVANITVYCLGEVSAPGAQTFSTNERATVMAAIARAGGLTDRARRRLTIQRTHRDGSVEEIPVDYRKIFRGTQPDIDLQHGDVLKVGESFL